MIIKKMKSNENEYYLNILNINKLLIIFSDAKMLYQKKQDYQYDRK